MDLTHCYCVVAVCLAYAGSSNGEGVLLADILNGTGGQSVVFRSQQPPDIELFSVSWRVVLKNGSEIFIITTLLSDSDIISPEYSPRTNLNRSTGSLELFNLTLDDSGSYYVVIVAQNGHPQTGVSYLQVYEAVSNVTVTPNNTQLLEFNSSVSLSCSVSTGTSLSYLWMNGSTEITASSVGVQIGPEGTNLTVLNVTRYDSGPYHCRVFNPVSSGTSAPFSLHPSYGPENITIDGPAVLETGQLLRLFCMVGSTPPAELTWITRTQIIGHGTEFIKNVTASDNGEFTCRAENNVTKLSVLAVHRLSVTEASDTHSDTLTRLVIVGIFVVVLVAGVLMYHFHLSRTKNGGKVNFSTRGTSDGGYVRDSVLSTREMNPANINYYKKNYD